MVYLVPVRVGRERGGGAGPGCLVAVRLTLFNSSFVLDVLVIIHLFSNYFRP